MNHLVSAVIFTSGLGVFLAIWAVALALEVRRLNKIILGLDGQIKQLKKKETLREIRGEL
ncbi:MAG: hypothetical protein KTR16_12715 [Acidiferrobacterales bacterium]|nr:hypothetical protein [Acidiferrobacterales bacterium]